MGAPKPTLGYPSRTAAVLALKAKGHARREIADRIGITVKTVDSLLHSAARGAPKVEPSPSFRLPARIARTLAPHAERRGVSCGQLAQRIVETVANENMVDAVLDDAGAFEAEAMEEAS